MTARQYKLLEEIRQRHLHRKEYCKSHLFRKDNKNNLVYGLCKEYGIDTTNMDPPDCWEALKKKTGKDSDYFYHKAEQVEKEEKSKKPKKPRTLTGNKIPKKEKAHVYSEISTLYHSRFSEKQDKTCGIAVAKCYYFFDNYGFGNYSITKRIPIEGNEKLIKKFEDKVNGN